MRSIFTAVALAFGVAAAASAQTCTGLQCQQVSCPAGSTTTVSGVVYAPNGKDPLPNVIVYVPNAAVAAFTPGVSCPAVGQAPSGLPLVGTTTAVDGSFTINNVPVGTSIPLVAVSGRWRRQTTIDTSAGSCANTVVPSDSIRMPRNHLEGDIPKIAIATGGADAVECVLTKMQIDPLEFTDPGGGGRINLFLGSGAPGVAVDSSTPNESVLMGSTDPTGSVLMGYDVLMLPCEGTAAPAVKTQNEYNNLIAFANAGGRVYSSHYSYQWMYNNPPFNTVANWNGTTKQGSSVAISTSNLPATVNQNFSGGLQLSQWLQLVGASTTQGQIPVGQTKYDFNGVNPPTEAWLTLNDATYNNPVMQMVFDTPVGASGAQCGRVLYNEYHVETAASSSAAYFPNECAPGTTLNAQEQLLEYSLFELTNDGGSATLTPTTQDFGTQAVGFNSPTETFTWTNKSTFAASVNLVSGSGDFSIVSNGCNAASVPGGASCQIVVVFNPSVIGPRTGTLSVGSGGTTLISSLTGTGIPDLSVSSTALTYGSVDVGFSVSQGLTVTNAASGPVPVPAFVTTGDYSTTNNCGSSLSAGASCTVNVIFKPTTTGTRTGTLTVQSATPGSPSTMTGNGIDFTIASLPTSGTAIAGTGITTTVTTTPLAGFSNNLSLTCATTAPGTNCVLSQSTYTSGSATNTTLAITTTSQYAVIGYSGFGGYWLSLIAAVAGLLLWTRRRAVGSLARSSLTVLLLAFLFAAGSMGLTGCSGKLPAENAVYTPPGTYSFTVSATDGFLVHAVSYSLNVTVK